MTEAAALTELTGAGFTARTAAGEPVVLTLMHGPGEGVVTLTIGERTVEVPLDLFGLKHLRDVGREKHANALFLGVAGLEPCVPRRESIPG